MITSERSSNAIEQYLEMHRFKHRMYLFNLHSDLPGGDSDEIIIDYTIKPGKGIDGYLPVKNASRIIGYNV